MVCLKIVLFITIKHIKMEEEDELIPHPDVRGLLDLTNRAWIHLDPILWTMLVPKLHSRIYY